MYNLSVNLEDAFMGGFLVSHIVLLIYGGINEKRTMLPKKAGLGLG